MHTEILFKFLTYCVPFEQSTELCSQFRDIQKYFNNWEDVLSEVENHGMAPLVNYHLRKSGILLPKEVQRNLSALALRHKLINEVRTNILLKLQNLFSQQGIPFLVLKGAALAQWLYPSPALRPMKDMDLLIRTNDCKIVTELLNNCGFHQIIDQFFHTSELHLPTFSKEVEGFNISIEVHHRLLPEGNKRFWGYLDSFKMPNYLIKIAEGTVIETINPEEFLYHLCKHTFFSYHNLEPLRMIWVADILNFSEKFKNDIDWGFLHQNYPLVRHTLTALHELIPLSPKLIEKAKISPRKNPETSIRPYQGWPGVPMRDVKPGERWQWIKDTCFPCGWVLFLHYGNGLLKAKWYNWLKHIKNLIEITIVHMKIRYPFNN